MKKTPSEMWINVSMNIINQVLDDLKENNIIAAELMIRHFSDWMPPEIKEEYNQKRVERILELIDFLIKKLSSKGYLN